MGLQRVGHNLATKQQTTIIAIQIHGLIVLYSFAYMALYHTHCATV